MEFNSSAISGERLRREAVLDGMFRMAADADNNEVGFGSVATGPASCKSGHVRYAESGSKRGALVKQRSRIMLLI